MLTGLSHNAAVFGPGLKAVHDRYGKDGRLMTIGFSLANDPADAARFIKDNGLTWPQVVLRERGGDPIVLDYQNWYPFKSFPDRPRRHAHC
jgi:hypothetical protein